MEKLLSIIGNFKIQERRMNKYISMFSHFFYEEKQLFEFLLATQPFQCGIFVAFLQCNMLFCLRVYSLEHCDQISFFFFFFYNLKKVNIDLSLFSVRLAE